MFSDRTFNTLVFVTNFAWNIGVVNFRYVREPNGTGHFLETSLKPSRLHLVRVTFTIGFLYIAFIAGRAIQKGIATSGNGEPSSLGFFIKMGYLFSSYALPVVIQNTTVIHPVEAPRFILEYIKFFKDVKAKYLLPDQKGAKCRKFFTAMMTVGMFVNLQNIVIIMVKPHQEHFVTSILENPKKASIILRLPLILYQFYIWTAIWGNIYCYCFHWFTHISSFLFLFKELDIHVKTPRTYQTLRQPLVVAKLLRSMQVLHRFWEDSMRGWLAPSHKAIVVSVGVSALYGLIKLRGPRQIVMGCACILIFLYISALFYKFGQLYEKSRRTLENWENSTRATRFLRKVVQSIPVFGIYVGDFYCVNRTTVINVIFNIFNTTITLLLL